MFSLCCRGSCLILRASRTFRHPSGLIKLLTLGCLYNGSYAFDGRFAGAVGPSPKTTNLGLTARRGNQHGAVG